MPRKPTRAVQLGVTDADYHRMLAEQDGHCALCPAVPKTRRFSTDHNHKTGAVRGLLCHRCNRALPTWITVAWLHRAADYIALDNSTAVVLAPSGNSVQQGLTTEGAGR